METQDFINTLNQLKATDDDFEIAVSNLKNLKVDDIYIIMLGKELIFDKRKEFIKEFPTVTWPEGNNFTYRVIHSYIKERNDSTKDIFTYMVSKSISDGIVDIEQFNFVESIKVNLRW